MSHLLPKDAAVPRSLIRIAGARLHTLIGCL